MRFSSLRRRWVLINSEWGSLIFIDLCFHQVFLQHSNIILLKIVFTLAMVYLFFSYVTQKLGFYFHTRTEKTFWDIKKWVKTKKYTNQGLWWCTYGTLWLQVIYEETVFLKIRMLVQKWFHPNCLKRLTFAKYSRTNSIVPNSFRCSKVR